MEGPRVKAKWLEDRFPNPLPVDAPDALVQQYARFYIVEMLGGRLFMDKGGDRISIMYLQFFDPISNGKRYSWGSAALSRRSTAIGAVVGVGEISTHMSCDEASTAGTTSRSTCYQVCSMLDSYRFTFPH